MTTSVDFAARLISPQAIKNAGHSAVMVYVSNSRPGSNFGAKPVTRAYADECRRVGLDLVSIFQFGKPSGTAPSDWTTGYDGGHRMALQARDTHFSIGGPGHCPIYFAVDEDITVDQWNNTAVNFFKGACDAIGREWVGVYGSSKVCAWAIEDNVIGGVQGARWAWQTRSWSNGEREAQATLFQRVIDTASSPGPQIDGSAVDVNDILTTDFGQWSINRAPSSSSPPPVSGRPDMQEVDQTGVSPNHSSRNGIKVRLFVLHTQEGDGDAFSLARFLQNAASQVSYHYSVDNGTCVDVVDTNEYSWSVLDANPYTINLCFAGSRVSMSRQEWLDKFGKAIDFAAWQAVQDSHKYGYAAKVVNWDELRAGASGITDHSGITHGLGIGTHTDVGPNFPWDVFTAAVNRYATGVPVSNAINDCAAANIWVGDRITQDETVCPDGKGRFTEFKNAHIYWSPDTGAHAIPHGGLFEAFAEFKFESGVLGYPVKDFSKVSQGGVQAFQNGVLYRKDNSAHGFWVHGAILDRYAKVGYENSVLGWPVANEEDHDAGKVQRFEHGSIYWDPSNTVVVIP